MCGCHRLISCRSGFPVLRGVRWHPSAGTGQAARTGEVTLLGACVRAGAPAGIAYPSALEGKQLVPQLLVPPGMMPPPQGAARLTAAQAAELEMARRRAQKVRSAGLRRNAAHSCFCGPKLLLLGKRWLLFRGLEPAQTARAKVGHSALRLRRASAPMRLRCVAPRGARGRWRCGRRLRQSAQRSGHEPG